MAAMPVLLSTLVLYGRFVRDITKSYQDSLAAAAQSGNESISNARVMRSFGAEELECSKYQSCIEDSYGKGRRKAMAYGAFIGAATGVVGVAVLAVLYYGALLVVSGELRTTELTAFALYTLYIAMALGSLSSLFTEFMSAVGASKR